MQEQQPKKRGNVVPQISNEVQMIEVLTSIIMSAPHHSIQISTMSQRIQELTKNNWNKKYKYVIALFCSLMLEPLMAQCPTF